MKFLHRLDPHIKTWHLVVALCAVIAITVVAVTSTSPKPTTKAVVAQAKDAVKAVTVPPSTSVVEGHVCTPKDATMSCTLTGMAPLAPQTALDLIKKNSSPAFSSVQGVDFAWSCPVSQAHSFGASYLSYDSSKDWTKSCVDAFHNSHKTTAFVWEAGASDTLGGCSVGAREAQQAAAELRALGAPANQPFTMAIDFDATGSQLATIAEYFRCASNAEPGRVNAYGGYDQIQYLFAHHVVGHLNWQTYAWSGGRWLPASVAPLEQYLNSSSVDFDRAIAPNFGQWPSPGGPTKPTLKAKCFGSGWHHTKQCNQIRQQAYNLGKNVKHLQGYIKVSQTNDAKLTRELHLVQQRLGVEQKKVKAVTQQLEKLLGEYGYKPKK